MIEEEERERKERTRKEEGKGESSLKRHVQRKEKISLRDTGCKVETGVGQ